MHTKVDAHEVVFSFNFSLWEYLCFKDFIYLFLERGREGEREGEKHQCVVASCMAPTGDLTRNPGMCPAWELNQRLCGSQASAQSIEPLQPGQHWTIFKG